MDTGYNLERRLYQLDPDLHRRYKDCVLTSGAMLTRYQSTFPEYTDQTVLHTMNVIDFCNQLIGDQVDRLTADDIYVLLMGCLFHEVGMGVSREDYEHFKPQLSHSSSLQNFTESIRNNHHELSALYLEKYWKMLDIPNEGYLFAIIQLCRGHRKTDLTDPKRYPEVYSIGEGHSVYLSYLASLLCLSNEMDIAVDRNIGISSDIDSMNNPRPRMEFAKHQAIRAIELDENAVTLHIQSNEGVVQDEIMLLCEKLGDTLHYCRMVVDTCAEFSIKQKFVRFVMDKME